MIRRKMNVVIDCETVGNRNRQRVINIGFVFGDNKGNIHKTKEFNIKENIELGLTYPVNEQYYLDKVQFLDCTWVETMKEVYDWFRLALWEFAGDYDIDLYSYNAQFDSTAILSEWELKKLVSKKNSDRLFDNWYCIMNVCTMIHTTPTYKRWIDKVHRETGIVNKFKTLKGNRKTTAESTYCFIKQDPYFEEDHTGLSDSLIEYEILMYCKSKGKKLYKEKISSLEHYRKAQGETINKGWL